jgi:hypothetical protein
MLLVWAIGVCLMWTKARLSLLRQANPRVPTKYEATLMLASDIDLSLGTDNRPDTYQSIDRYIAQDLRGGRISVFETTNGTDFGLWKEFSKWIKQNKWWFAGLVILTPYSIFGWVLAPLALFVFVVVLNAAIIFALAVGATPNARFGFFFCGVVLAIVSGVIVVARGNPWMCKFGLYEDWNCRPRRWP